MSAAENVWECRDSLASTHPSSGVYVASLSALFVLPCRAFVVCVVVFFFLTWTITVALVAVAVAALTRTVATTATLGTLKRETDRWQG